MTLSSSVVNVLDKSQTRNVPSEKPPHKKLPDGDNFNDVPILFFLFCVFVSVKNRGQNEMNSC